MNRLFMALWPTAAVREGLAQWHRPLLRAGRPVPPERLHMTLGFIGDFPETGEPLLKDRLTRIKAPAFTMVLDQWGRFERSRTLWVGPSSPPPALLALRAEVVGVLERFGQTLEAEFIPHVTLARQVTQAPSDLLPPDLYWPVDAFALVRSRLTGQRPEYRTLARFRLIDEQAESPP